LYRSRDGAKVESGKFKVNRKIKGSRWVLTFHPSLDPFHLLGPHFASDILGS
jgi:hypothetical protein